MAEVLWLYIYNKKYVNEGQQNSLMRNTTQFTTVLYADILRK